MHTSIARIKAARAFFAANPEGRLSTGIRDDPVWTRDEFNRWFLNCLHAKISASARAAGRKLAPEYQAFMRRDCHRVRDYRRRIRNTGCRNLLSTPELKRRYPFVDNQPLVD